MKQNKEVNIKKYDSLFHDGSIEKITHEKTNSIELWMESAEVRPEWNEDNILLSKRCTITGKLHLEEVGNIQEDKNIQLKIFEIRDSYESARIYDFEIKKNTVALVIYWIKYLPEYEESKDFQYEIEAGKIYWENIPTLFDDYWDSL